MGSNSNYTLFTSKVLLHRVLLSSLNRRNLHPTLIQLFRKGIQYKPLQFSAVLVRFFHVKTFLKDCEKIDQNPHQTKWIAPFHATQHKIDLTKIC